MRTIIKPEIIVIGILAGLIACALDASQLFTPLSQEFYRIQFALRGAQPGSAQVVVLKIDEQSVKELGKFPWPRSRYVEIVDRLEALGARAIAFDFAFADATPDDAAFAAACSHAGNVYLPVRIAHTELGTEYREPPAEIAKAAAGLGHIFLADSSRERVYKIALERGGNQEGYFSLSLLVALAGLGIDESEILPPTPAQYRIGPLRVPTGADHQMTINYAGTGFAQFSCADLYAGRLSDRELQGKLVLIGVQLPNYPAEYQVPMNRANGVMSDVLIQANAIDTLLRQRFITPLTIPYWLYAFPLIAATWVQSRAQGRRRALSGLTLSGLYITLAILLFVAARFLFDPLILLIGSLLSAIGVTYLEILRNMRRLRRLQPYAPPHLGDESGQPAIRPEGEQKRAAILFADAKSFTAMAERQDSRKVYQLMKQCMQILVDETYRAGGAIDKFTGDGIMALFGVPHERPDDAERAVRAALNMQQALQRFNREHSHEYETPLQVRIGLNIGPVVVGDIGSNDRMNFTAMGDTVNVAARLEQCAEPGAILVSEEIRKATADHFSFRALGPLHLKNRAQPVNTYEALGPRPATPHS